MSWIEDPAFTADEPATFRCSVDGGAATTCTSPLVLTPAEGRHTVTVSATDVMGNADATPAVAAFAIDRTAPALDLPDPSKVAYLTQTTLSVDEANTVIAAIRRKYPLARGPKGEDICYATQNRQDATKVLAERSDLVLVVGSSHSSAGSRCCQAPPSSTRPRTSRPRRAERRRGWWRQHLRLP